MKKLACIIAVALFVGAIAAQASATAIMPYYDWESPRDYYQVTFDGEGEATVLARFTKMNIGRDPILQLKMEIPGKHVTLKYVFQEVQEESCWLECYSYESECIDSEKVCTLWNEQNNSCEAWEDRCLAYEDQCINYEEICEYYGGTTFVTLDFKKQTLSKSTQYTIDLEQPIYSTETGTILVYYKVDGYVEKDLAYNFDFETAKFPMDTEYVRVSVSTDADLYLKGEDSTIDYMPNFESYAAEASKDMAMSAGATSYFRDVSSDVQYASGFVREARNLDPWESFHVTGKYVDEEYKWLLHLNWVAGVALVLIALKLLWKPITKKLKLPKGKIARVASYGFLSGFSLVWAGWLFMGLWSLVERWMNWYVSPLFGLSLLAASGVVLGAIIVWPAYKNGKKFGFGAGIVTAICAVFSASLLSTLVAIVLG